MLFVGGIVYGIFIGNLGEIINILRCIETNHLDAFGSLLFFVHLH